MLIRSGVVAAALLCAGCGHYIDAKARNQALQSAQPSYAGVGELPFEKIAFPADFRFSIDEKSPVLDFGYGDNSDKSYVRGFELPAHEGEYQIVLRSYLLRDGLFTPAIYFGDVLLLDEEKKPVRGASIGGWENVFRVLSDELLYDRDRWREYTQRIPANSRIRYMLIHTNRYLVDTGGTVWTPPKDPLQLAAGTHIVPIFIPSGGSGGPIKVEGSVVGDFRLFLEEAPH